MNASSPARKAGSISNTCELPWPVRGDMKKRPPTKPVWGRTAPVCSVELYGCASSWLLPTVARRWRAVEPNMMATSGFQRPWVYIHLIIPRALRQRATHNIGTAVEPEEWGKLAHGRLQSILPVRAKTRMQTITPHGTPGSLCLSNLGRRQTAIFL